MFKYENLTPFQNFCCNNFPFIEETFDSLTTYKMLCKIVGYLQDEIIPNVDNIGNSQNEVIEKFNELKNFVDNYFDNLDVQEEINNKLDEMATDGTLENIINQEIFGTINQKISTLETNVGTLQDDMDTAENNISKLQNINLSQFDKNGKTIFIGDSYATYSPDGNITKDYVTQITEILGLNNPYNFHRGGSGFVGGAYSNGQGGTFLKLIQDNINNITDKNEIKNIVVLGGYNDFDDLSNDIPTGIKNFCDYCHTQFPNATIFIGMIAYNTLPENSTNRSQANAVTKIYSDNAIINHAIYLNNSQFILRCTDFMSSDGLHPNQKGHNQIAKYISQCLLTGNCTVIYQYLYAPEYETCIQEDYEFSTKVIETRINGIISVKIPDLNFIFNSPWSETTARVITSVFKKLNFKMLKCQGFEIKKQCIVVGGDSSTSNLKVIPAKISITNSGDYNMQLHYVGDNGSYQKLENVSYLSIRQSDFVFSDFNYGTNGYM